MVLVVFSGVEPAIARLAEGGKSHPAAATQTSPKVNTLSTNYLVPRGSDSNARTANKEKLCESTPARETQSKKLMCSCMGRKKQREPSIP